MNVFGDNLANLRAQPWFQDYINKVLKPQCPRITPYYPNRDGSEWEYESGLREGYIRAFKQMGIEFND